MFITSIAVQKNFSPLTLLMSDFLSGGILAHAFLCQACKTFFFLLGNMVRTFAHYLNNPEKTRMHFDNCHAKHVISNGKILEKRVESSILYFFLTTTLVIVML